MNYGKKSVKQKKKALQSTSSKLGRKCLLTFSKVLLLCVIAIGIIGICAGLGVFKGIIDSVPTITLEDATPTRYSSFIYDSKGNQMAKLIADAPPFWSGRPTVRDFSAVPPAAVVLLFLSMES